MLLFKAYRKSPALTQETTPSQRRITRILSEAQQTAAREFGQQRARVAELLSRGQVDRVVAMLPTEPWLIAQEQLAAELLGELLDAGSRVTLPSIQKETLSFSFDRARPESVSWARRQAGSLITEISSGQRNVVRDVIATAATGEADWGDVARQVQGSIGLTTQQAGWVSNFYERSFSNAIRGGASSSRAAAIAGDQAARYQASVHRYRANTIARTETMRAASEGRMQAWGQGLTDGFISPLWEKEWIAEADGCEICLGMNRKRVKVKESFSVGEPPAHPNCRCDVLLVPPTGKPQAGTGGGLSGLISFMPWEELAFEFIPTPSLDDIQEWRTAYRLATREGDNRSFQQWFKDIIEPDVTVYAEEGSPPEIRFGDENILSLLSDDVGVDDIFGEMFDEAYLEEKYRLFQPDWAGSDAVEALRDYQWKDFLRINGFLRSGAAELPGEYLSKIQLIDSLFDIAPPFRSGGEYFRTLDAKVLTGLKRGDTFIDEGYMSTSVSREVAEEFAEDSGYDGKMRIIDLSGSRKIYVDGITLEDGFDQGEVLFYRGTPLTYVGKDIDGWDVFTTASYKVDPPNRFAPRPPEPPKFREPKERPSFDEVMGQADDIFDRVAAQAQDEITAGRELDLGDRILHELYKTMGYDELPLVADEDTFGLLAQGQTVWFRGLRDKLASGNRPRVSAEELLEALRSGRYYAGYGVFGNGTYTSNLPGTAVQYGGGELGNVVRILLSPSAKVIEQKELFDLYADFIDTMPSDNAKRLASDLGRFAAALGYDAIRVEGGGLGGSEDYMVILNRGAMVIAGTNGLGPGIISSRTLMRTWNDAISSDPGLLQRFDSMYSYAISRGFTSVLDGDQVRDIKEFL
jgi:hypothetical protein